jgi:hypothetical protein
MNKGEAAAQIVSICGTVDGAPQLVSITHNTGNADAVTMPESCRSMSSVKRALAASTRYRVADTVQFMAATPLRPTARSGTLLALHRTASSGETESVATILATTDSYATSKGCTWTQRDYVKSP